MSECIAFARRMWPRAVIEGDGEFAVIGHGKVRRRRRPGAGWTPSCPRQPVAGRA
jgi:hypothetical protein